MIKATFAVNVLWAQRFGKQSEIFSGKATSIQSIFTYKLHL